MLLPAESQRTGAARRSRPRRGRDVLAVAVTGVLAAGSLLALTGQDAVTSPPIAGRPTASEAGWGDAALAHIAREAMAWDDGVDEALRFLAPDVHVDDRGWSRAAFEDRDGWRTHLIGAYQLTLDELHLQRVHLDPRGAVLQLHQRYVAGLGAPAHTVQLRDYGPDGVSNLRTAVSVSDLERRPAAGDADGFAALEAFTQRYLAAWSSGDPAAIGELYTPTAELEDAVGRLRRVGRGPIATAGADHVGVTAERRLATITGTDDPAVYIDARTPSRASTVVLVHTADGPGCPGTVAVQLELADGLIAVERRFHDVPSVRRCVAHPPAGWWTLPMRIGPIDELTGTVLVDGTEVPVFGSTPELDRLLGWALERFAAGGLAPPELASVTFASASGRCSGVAGKVEHHEDGARVLLCFDAGTACVGEGCERFTLHARLTTLHELAHTWDLTWLDDATREAYLHRTGLERWFGDGQLAWEERGVERAAETIMWGLLDEALPLPRLGDPPCDVLASEYRLLTGTSPSRPDCADR
jgi:hypothetical protein